MKEFGPPPSVTQQLREMAVETDIIIKTESPQTVFAIASRLKTQGFVFKGKRVEGGVQVWRYPNKPTK